MAHPKGSTLQAIIACAIALILPTLAMAQTGYGLRLGDVHLAAIFICSCTGPVFEREFNENKLDVLVKLKALEAEHGKEMMRVWLQRMDAVGLGDLLQRMDAVAPSTENCTSKKWCEAPSAACDSGVGARTAPTFDLLCLRVA